VKLPAYTHYKPSGVEWIGDLPEHWQVKRVKVVARLTDRKVEADEQIPRLYVGMENIESWTGRLLPINPDIVPTGTANLFNSRSTLFGKLRPYLAKACNPDFDGLCSTELLVLESYLIDRPTLLYSLLSDGFIKLVDSSTYGSKMPRANWDFIGNCMMPIAPREEQRQIAGFLNRETSRIDRLVGKKRELIERLKEKRTGLITRTVTRGLPPDAARAVGFPENKKLKPSGFDWIGDIPEHWKVNKLKRLASVRGRIGFRGYTTDDLVDADEGALALGATHMRDDGNVDLNDPVYISWAKYYESPEIMVEVGDLLVAQRGSTSGKVAIIKEQIGPATINPSVVLLKQPSINGRFLLYCLLGHFVQHSFRSYLSATAIPMLSQQQIGSVDICTPPAQEQDAIVAYLDRELALLNALLTRVETALQRLQEYRTALITAAVTGKIDVRSAVA